MRKFSVVCFDVVFAAFVLSGCAPSLSAVDLNPASSPQDDSESKSISMFFSKIRFHG
jgi:hypothetical protein